MFLFIYLFWVGGGGVKNKRGSVWTRREIPASLQGKTGGEMERGRQPDSNWTSLAAHRNRLWLQVYNNREELRPLNAFGKPIRPAFLPCDDPTSEIFRAINIPMGIIPFQTQFALLLRPVAEAGGPEADAICSHSSQALFSYKRAL